MSTNMMWQPGSSGRGLTAVGLAMAALGALGCADPTLDPDDVTTEQSEIQGGQLETGHLGVGYIGPLGCTGALITQEWVLTAKHCASQSPMTFVVGNTSTSGVSYAVDRLIKHPTNDLMLMHLTNPIEGVPIYPINEGPLPAVNTVCTAVGFGLHNVGTQETTGTKRSATSRVTSADANTIVVEMVTGVADSGDSGGPLLCDGKIAAVVWRHDDGLWPAHVTEIYTTVDPPWIATTVAPTYAELALTNGWTNAPFGTRNASVSLVSGIVRFKGAIKTTGTNMSAFTLPANMRPPVNVYVPVDLFGGAKGRLNILSTGVVNVQAESAVSDAQQFTSLEGASFALNTNGFTTFILQNGWTAAPFGTGNPGAMDIGGVLHFKGAMRTTGTNMRFTFIPLGMHPATDVYIPLDLLNSRKGTLKIEPDGDAFIQFPSGSMSDAQQFTSLDGASFVIGGTTGFAPLSLVNGWATAPSSGAPGVAKISGVVHLNGAMATAGTNSTAFTLPVGFRPAVNVYVSVDLCNAAKGRLFISPTGAVSVGVAPGGAWSNAQCRTSLEGVSFTASDFTPLSLESGWSHAPFGTGRAGAAISAGIVQLRGAMGTAGAVATAFTLPPPFRPGNAVYLPVNLCDAAKGRLVIQPTGVATVVSADGNFGAASCFTSLDGVSFPVSTSSFTPLAPLSNGWTNANLNTRPPSVANVGGIVRLAGAMKTTGSSMTAFTLPPSVRPPTNIYVPVDLVGGKKGRLNIEPSGVVTVQSAGAPSDAQQFTSLEGAWFALSTTTFNQLTPQNGWTNAPFGTRNAGASSSLGIVRLGGAIATSGTNSVPFTLPLGYRPPAITYVSVDMCGAAQGRLAIDPNGTITVAPFGPDFAPAACFTSLEGVTFGL